jgi:3-phosphoshikimate 1-carboxyvinyltransferase
LDKVTLQRLSGKLNGEIGITGSKSISNRLLIIEALTDKKKSIRNLSGSEDTKRLRTSLHMVKTCATSRIPMVVDAGNAGTVMRFLTALLAVTEGKWLLTGSDRMKKRPVGELVKALKKLGADINYAGTFGFPPLRIKGAELRSKVLELDVAESSQFVSALMMVAPELGDGLKINFKNRPVSFPYIKMTAQMMQEFGVEVLLTDKMVEVKPGDYASITYSIEPDWSSASYWYEMAALSGSVDLLLTGFTKDSLQGDHILPVIFENFGIKTVFEKKGVRLSKSGINTKYFQFNFESYPDLVPAVLATCAAKGIAARIEGINHLKFKESDRLEVLKTELAKVGAEILVSGNIAELVPPVKMPEEEIVFDTYDDHRIAMSLAPLALKFGKVTINKPGVVQKSYTLFWKDIQQSGVIDVDKK